MFSPAIYPVIFSGSLDPEVAAWRSAVVANGGSVSGGAVAAVSRFVRGCKADGTWSLVSDVGLLAGVDNLSAAIVKLKTPLASRTFTNVNFVAADYTATGASAGIIGNATTKYLNTGLAPSAVGTVGDYSYGAVVQTWGSLNPGIGGAADFGNTGIVSVDAATPSSAQHRIGGTTQQVTASNLAPTLCVVSATSATDLRAYRNGAQVGSTQTGLRTAITTRPFFLFAFNANGTPSFYGNQRISFYFQGRGMTDAQVAAFSTRVNDLMRAFGCNTY